MAKIKVKFTEDLISLIKCLNFDVIGNGFYVNQNNPDVEIDNYNGNKFNLHDLVNKRTYQFDVENKNNYGDNIYGIDTYSLYGGTYIWEQMALILGKEEDMIPETRFSPTGPRYKEETMKYFKELDGYIVEHIKDIEEILHQFCTEGIEVDVEYWRYDTQHFWYKKEKENASN